MTDKIRYRVWSEKKEFTLYSAYSRPEVLVAAYDYAISQGSTRWVEVEHFGLKCLVRWDTITMVELYNQNVPF